MIKIIAQEQLTGYTRKSSGHGGLFKISNDLLFCNIVHGSEDGTLWIEPNEGNMVKIYFVENFRFMLFQLLGIKDTGQVVLINPCHPQSIIKHCGSSLEEQNIKVLEFGSNKICRGHQNPDKLFFYIDWRQTRKDFTSYAQMEREVDETITCLADIEKTEIEYTL